MPKWLFWLAFFFVLFLIYTQPGNAGAYAGNFADFAVDLLNAIGEFLTGLFEGASRDGAGGGLDNTTLSSDTGSTANPSYSHEHGGVEHSHGG